MIALFWIGCTELPSGGSPSSPPPPPAALDGNQWGEESGDSPILRPGRLRILSGATLVAGDVSDALLLEIVGTDVEGIGGYMGVLGDVDGDGLDELGTLVDGSIGIVPGTWTRAGGSLDPALLPRAAAGPAGWVFPHYPGDVTGDTVPDLLVAAYQQYSGSYGSLEIHSGTGLLTGDPPVARIVDGVDHGVWLQVMCGDVNGDGVGDVLTWRRKKQRVEAYDRVLFLGPFAGDRDVDAPDAVFGSGVWPLSIGDVDGDGRNEMMVMTEQGDHASRMGVFDLNTLTSSAVVSAEDARWAWETSDRVWSVDVLGDVDGDGGSELVVLGQNWDPLEAFSRLGLDAAEPDLTFDFFYGQDVTMGDLDGDGRQDLAIRDTKHLYVFDAVPLDGTRLDPALAVRTHAFVPPLGHARAVPVGDVDGDGSDDLAFPEPWFGE